MVLRQIKYKGSCTLLDDAPVVHARLDVLLRQEATRIPDAFTVRSNSDDAVSAKLRGAVEGASNAADVRLTLMPVMWPADRLLSKDRDHILLQ